MEAAKERKVRVATYGEAHIETIHMRTIPVLTDSHASSCCSSSAA